MTLKPSKDFRESIAEEKTWTDKQIDAYEAEVYGGKPLFHGDILELIEQLRRARRVALQLRLPGTKK